MIYGNGDQTRDSLYVTDTAKAAIDTYNSKNTKSKVLNIASGKEISIRSLITMICEYMGYTKPIIFKKERPGDVRRHIANIYLAEDLIGFKPMVTFQDGLKKTIDWYVQNFKNP